MQAAPAPGASCQASFSSLCGTVVDAGDGSTQVIPVVDGYVLGSSVKTLPVAGADVTAFIQTLMRQRGEPLPLENSVDVCRCGHTVTLTGVLSGGRCLLLLST